MKYDPHVWTSTFLAVRGTMLGVIARRSLLVTLVAAALTAIHQFGMPINAAPLNTVHAFVTPAISLLLVFRTNSSYDRWWEGRRLWGAMVNTCRNLARQASVHLPAGSERLAAVLKLTQAFPGAAMHLLRNKQWSKDQLFEGAPSERQLSRTHGPLALSTAISRHLKEALAEEQVSDIVFAALDADSHMLVDIIGGCERIHKTPLPFAYVVHLRRALVIYCATLPLVLVSTFGWANLAVVFLVSYILFGIDEIGVEIEDPFGLDDNDLPLEAITEGIERNVRAYEHKA